MAESNPYDSDVIKDLLEIVDKHDTSRYDELYDYLEKNPVGRTFYIYLF